MIEAVLASLGGGTDRDECGLGPDYGARCVTRSKTSPERHWDHTRTQ
jgi:hypothetical protein